MKSHPNYKFSCNKSYRFVLKPWSPREARLAGGIAVPHVEMESAIALQAGEEMTRVRDRAVWGTCFSWGCRVGESSPVGGERIGVNGKREEQ